MIIHLTTNEVKALGESSKTILNNVELTTAVIEKRDAILSAGVGEEVDIFSELKEYEGMDFTESVVVTKVNEDCVQISIDEEYVIDLLESSSAIIEVLLNNIIATLKYSRSVINLLVSKYSKRFK